MSDYNIDIKKLYDNPELYIAEFSDYKDDIYFWKKIVLDIAPKSMLEIGIGNGRLINLLHDKVDEYDGIDFSKKLINYCRKKYKYSNVRLYCQDIKNFKNDKKYDLIILPFNVINNFYTKSDLDKLFCSIKNLCNKNTIIIIDTINPTISDLISRDKYLKTNEFNYKNYIIKVYENKKFDNLNMTCIYHKIYKTNNNIVNEAILPNRIFFNQELNLMLDYYGFVIINQYGDYNFEPLNQDSRKQLLLLRRK